MKYTLLEMVQEVLSSMDSDEVNSISDTVESYQVALLIKGCFYDIATELSLPEHETMFQLNPSTDGDQPVLMTVPSNITRIHWIDYDKREATDTNSNFQRVEYMPLDEFLEMQNGYRNQDSNVEEMTFSSNNESFTMMYATNKQPKYFTTFDDYTLLFDSYDSSIESTLQKHKTQCAGRSIPVFLMEDSFIPDLEAQQFAYFRNRVKTRAFAELKQAANQESAKEARNQKIIIQNRKRTTPDVPEVYKVGARYGRRSVPNKPTTIARDLRQGD